MSASGFVQIMRVADLKIGAPPIDITDIVRAADPNALPRILVRFDATDAPNDSSRPSFFSLARTCTHKGCNVLTGGSWGSTTKPLMYFTLDANGVGRPVIECPCHGTRFDLITGTKVRNPESGAATDLRRFATAINDVNGEPFVFVAIQSPTDGGPGI